MKHISIVQGEFSQDSGECRFHTHGLNKLASRNLPDYTNDNQISYANKKAGPEGPAVILEACCGCAIGYRGPAAVIA